MPQAELFKTILCPVDFSDHSKQALQYACVLALRSKAALVVLYVEDPLLTFATEVKFDVKLMRASMRAELNRFVRRAVSGYDEPLTRLTLEIASGKPAIEIDRVAARCRADLIVLGSHGLSGASRMVMGSTTHRVLQRSPLPVLAVPPAIPGRRKSPPVAWPGPQILAPLSLGRRGRSHALAVARIARELGAQLVLVHVVEALPSFPWLKIDAATQNRQRIQRAHARLESIRETVRDDTIDCRVLSGAPAQEIAAAAAEHYVGLVVMVRQAGQGLFGARQGAISYQVLCESHTPVLALPQNSSWIRRPASRKAKQPSD